MFKWTLKYGIIGALLTCILQANALGSPCPAKVVRVFVDTFGGSSDNSGEIPNLVRIGYEVMSPKLLSLTGTVVMVTTTGTHPIKFDRATTQPGVFKHDFVTETGYRSDQLGTVEDIWVSKMQNGNGVMIKCTPPHDLTPLSADPNQLVTKEYRTATGIR